MTSGSDGPRWLRRGHKYQRLHEAPWTLAGSPHRAREALLPVCRCRSVQCTQPPLGQTLVLLLQFLVKCSPKATARLPKRLLLDSSLVV